MDSTFLNLIRGNRVTAYMGLKTGDDNQNLRYGPSYQYIEIPVRCFRKEDGTELPEAKANQHLEVVPDCTIKVRGGQAVLVQYNPELQKVASIAGCHYVWPGGPEQVPSFYATFRKGITIEELGWAVRLSLLA